MPQDDKFLAYKGLNEATEITSVDRIENQTDTSNVTALNGGLVAITERPS